MVARENATLPSTAQTTGHLCHSRQKRQLGREVHIHQSVAFFESCLKQVQAHLLFHCHLNLPYGRCHCDHAPSRIAYIGNLNVGLHFQIVTIW